MEMYKDLCSNENLLSAFKKARKGKTQVFYVKEFEKNLLENIFQLKVELHFQIYKPKPLVHFMIKDPKRRKISKSDFRDRVVHHGLYNKIEPLFEKSFIYDSYANRKGKGTLKALERFNTFKRKVSKNNTRTCYILKADIKKYFETVDHRVLLALLKRRIHEEKILWLIKIILDNHHTKEKEKGMPLGNLTSQFFANVYLHELDFFVKQKLKAKYYIRYVDDFVIFHHSKNALKIWKSEINDFLRNNLLLGLHPEKSKIIFLEQGIDFLGMRIFPYHKLLRKRNIKHFLRKKECLYTLYKEKICNYEDIYNFLEGWQAYASHANTYKLRKKLGIEIEKHFSKELSSKEVNKYLKLSKPPKPS
ncbi:MAG: RNA-directed DNA polymerase [archaeon GW2011_AR17]|nr:MAG: RNA-directed DNA polymerase [archaeon GW2011_AR17]MBS3154075.1 group II intron reverse transcriptase domain-containing protein [Candidatus Woesearchaeota archaeon]HIH15535.1 hypothetical protein [Nanoarchaeota archaeon]HIH59133.1 hypothetical protein [Nanoarchaeota archaeon]HII14579.1 hypothetical protein [Nanoarchaeota archaeon]